jgi:hypothetical protein
VSQVDKADLTRIAAEAGLTRLSDQYLQQLQFSLAAARELADKLPKDLHWSEELSLTFRLPRPTGAKP